MSDAIITVENLGKKYQLTHQGVGRGSATLRETITEKGASLFRALALRNGKRSGGESAAPPKREEFWALRNVSFEVKQGEVMGIIGRNGAGKSTLLKLLSRITEPTEGRVRIRGRVASLLEVGTGFHPELTGRENIFLNGAILGMSRAEIKRKFDEIVDFAGTEKFLDTPVKRYSSGMYVRLAFAIAAHLEPEILVVDEVLSVGDAEFQKKCLGKMQDVSTGGRTVLFVSHNLGAIQRLCQLCVLLSNGHIDAAGKTGLVVERYMQEVEANSGQSLEQITNRSGNGAVRLVDFHIEDEEGCASEIVQSGSSFYLVFGFRCSSQSGAQNVNIGFSLHQPDETTLTVVYSSYSGQNFKNIPHSGVFRCRVNGLPLKEGRYYVGARIEVNGSEADWPKGMIGKVNVVAGESYPVLMPGQDGVAPLLISGDWSVTP
jgi:lipopolysaccharide transport system ATP-binding protein